MGADESPAAERVAALASAHGLPLVHGEASELAEAWAAVLRSDEQLVECVPSTGGGTRPAAACSDDDPCNAIARWCSVKSPSAGGTLAGMRIAVKDSISVAGVPLTCGSALLEDFVPPDHSEAARRVLAAGAEIVAITNMDDLAVSGAGDACRSGPIRNPFDLGRTAGGSSGGAAASLWDDRVDTALGTDQAGSIRIPASWCGVLGLKPTRGVVPYTGALPLDPLVDHLGALASTSGELAAVLEALAGVPPGTYMEVVESAPRDLAGLRIAIVEEGFSPETGVHPSTAVAVHEALARMSALGATVARVQLAEHTQAGGAYRPIGCTGVAALLAGGGADASGLAKALRDGMRDHGDALAPDVKLAALLGWHGVDRRTETLAASRRVARALMRATDALLSDVDVLGMPTTPTPARPVPDPALPLGERIRLAWGNSVNTVAANLSGHPAITLPTSVVDGMPVGLMLIAASRDEATLLRVARVYERELGWAPTMPARAA